MIVAIGISFYLILWEDPKKQENRKPKPDLLSGRACSDWVLKKHSYSLKHEGFI